MGDGAEDLCRWGTQNLRATQFRVQSSRVHRSCSLFAFGVRSSAFGVRGPEFGVASGTKNPEP